MNKIIALAILATSLTAFPMVTPSFAVDTSISKFCREDAPEAYKRRGGYCDIIGDNKSPASEGCEGYPYLELVSFQISGPSYEPKLLLADTHYCQIQL